MLLRVRHFDIRSRPRTVAIALSLLAHLAAFLALNPWQWTGLAGAPGAALGSGMDLVLVSEASLGNAAPNAPPMNDVETRPEKSIPPVVAAAHEATGGEVRLTPSADDPSHPATAQDRPKAVAWRSDGDARLDTMQDHEQRGAKDTAGGDPAAASAILSQIARCLPAGLRPNLPAQRLVLMVGANGQLTAAPMIDSSVPILTANDRAIADRVVQAALQCGPYTKAELLGQAVSVAVDFSEVRNLAANSNAAGLR